MTNFPLCPLGYKHGETEKTKRSSIRKLADQNTAIQEKHCTIQNVYVLVFWLLVQNLDIYTIQYAGLKSLKPRYTSLQSIYFATHPLTN